MPIGLYGISLLLGLLMRIELIRLADRDTVMMMLLLLCQQIMITIIRSGTMQVVIAGRAGAIG
jgi:hypothetical protein